jgi:hypothetical protein
MEQRKAMDTADQSLPKEEALAIAWLHANARSSLERLGTHVSRFGLVITLLSIGVLKFTACEAQGIQPLVANSPLMFWLYRIFSLQGVSNLIGLIEIVVALLIALRPFSVILLHRQHWSHYHLLAHCEFPLLYAECFRFITRVSCTGRCRAISHQGSCFTRCVDLDCR